MANLVQRHTCTPIADFEAYAHRVGEAGKDVILGREGTFTSYITACTGFNDLAVNPEEHVVLKFAAFRCGRYVGSFVTLDGARTAAGL
jgi:hypothetical protein